MKRDKQEQQDIKQINCPPFKGLFLAGQSKSQQLHSIMIIYQALYKKLETQSHSANLSIIKASQSFERPC